MSILAAALGERLVVPDDRPTAGELERLYSSLGTEERDDLLQEILVAWAKGETAVTVVVDAWLNERRAFTDEIAGGEA